MADLLYDISNHWSHARVRDGTQTANKSGVHARERDPERTPVFFYLGDNLCHCHTFPCEFGKLVLAKRLHDLTLEGATGLKSRSQNADKVGIDFLS